MSDWLKMRWMIRADMPDVIAITNQCFTRDPWTAADYDQVLRQRNTIGRVAVVDEETVGVLVYALHADFYDVLMLCVDPAWQRKGIASHMLAFLKAKTQSCRRDRIEFDAWEEQLGVQLFLRSQGFIADYIQEFDDDLNLIHFIFRKEWHPCAATGSLTR